jgi:imidazole glycerol phosphate synthase subunit HisF
MSPGLAIATAPPVADIQMAAGGGLSSLGQMQQSATSAVDFQQAMAGAVQRMDARATDSSNFAMQRIVQPLDHINAEAASLGKDARAASVSGQDLTPGELVNLTVRCQEFMFHCQLTSNIANRTSEGLQQLFRQQS